MASDNKIRFNCKCGKRFKLGAETINKRVICPDCGLSMSVSHMRGKVTVAYEGGGVVGGGSGMEVSTGDTAKIIGVATVLGAVAGAFLSQHNAWFGTVQQFPPWMGKQLSYLPSHLLLGAIAGAAIGGIGVFAIKRWPTK